MVNKTIFFLMTSLFTFNVYSAQPDWSHYDQLLQHYVEKQIVNGIPVNFVHYKAAFNDPVFEEIISTLETFPTNTLITKNEKLAFYINAYNIMAMKVIRDHWPLKSIKDAGGWFSSVWNKTAGKINGKNISLGEIENKILRPMNEPRIHFAIVCASLSCPDLRIESYNTNDLDGQLNDQVNKFLHNARKGLNVIGDTAKVSKIFAWYKEDFASENGVESFIKKYLPQIKFQNVDPALPYNWSLNGG